MRKCRTDGFILLPLVHLPLLKLQMAVKKFLISMNSITLCLLYSILYVKWSCHYYIVTCLLLSGGCVSMCNVLQLPWLYLIVMSSWCNTWRKKVKVYIWNYLQCKSQFWDSLFITPQFRQDSRMHTPTSLFLIQHYILKPSVHWQQPPECSVTWFWGKQLLTFNSTPCWPNNMYTGIYRSTQVYIYIQVYWYMHKYTGVCTSTLVYSTLVYIRYVHIETDVTLYVHTRHMYTHTYTT